MDFAVFIKVSLKSAGEIAEEKFGKVSGVTKTGDNNQVLTEADVAIGKHLIEQIEKEFPDHNIIDEEAGVIDKKSEFTWVVDPIDGTSNFANGVPTYGLMVGLLNNDMSIAGGIALPFFHEIYVGEKGKGAICNDKKLTINQEKKLSQCLIAYGIDGHQDDPSFTYQETKLLGEILLNIRNLRSSNSAFDAAMVAIGKYGGMLNRSSRIWDNVAQQIIIEEAGGIYTDFFGKPINYSSPLTKVDENYTYCAASPELHSQLQMIIHPIK